MKLLISLLLMLFALMMVSCAASNVYDNSPYVKIPDLPSNIYAKETTLPKIPKNATLADRERIAKQTLKNYRSNERHNIRAINSAIQHNKNLQEIYQKKEGTMKDQELSPWFPTS